MINFLILGAQKSGSSFIHACVREHPEVFMPSREIHFFEDPIFREDNLGEVEKLFESVTGKLQGIKRPQYLAFPECAERIYGYCPDAKLIVVLRNPVERAVSAYFHYMNYGMIPVRSMEAGMHDIVNGMYGKAAEGAREIIEFGFYQRQLQRYLRYFDREQLHVVLLDDIKANALSAVQHVYRFLGVDSTYRPASITSRPQAVLYSMPRLRLRSVRNPLVYTYDAKRTRSYPKKPGSLGQFLNRAILSVDRRLLQPLCSNRKPVLSSTLKESLLRLYREDIDNLETLLMRDLSSWKC